METYFSMSKLDSSLARFAAKRLMKLSPTAKIRHWEPSVLCSADDDTKTNSGLMAIALAASAEAYRTSLEELVVAKSNLPDSLYYGVFPGEHYRLLYALTKNLAPTNIIEIGTYTGMSAAALLGAMPEGCKLTTFDVIAWNQFQSHLSDADFTSGRIVQRLDDLSDSSTFGRYVDLFNQSQLIFCDAPKDGVFEKKFMTNLKQLKPKANCLLVLDDIRVMNMIDVWRSIQSPKLDLTSFGHWSGTGLVDLSNGLAYK
jgi:predicted O-methyltransferase YrrM